MRNKGAIERAVYEGRLKMQTNARPVTPEVAGSSPVSLAINQQLSEAGSGNSERRPGDFQKNEPGSFRCEPQPGDVIVVWFSTGAASAVALQETIRRYGDTCTIRAVNNPVAEEDEDNLRFAQDVSAWLGIDVETCINPEYPEASAKSVWDRRKAMSFPRGAPCTVHLKKEARQYFERYNNIDWHVFGFSLDEKRRHDTFIITERSNVIPVLIDAGLTKADCLLRLRQAGLRLPRVYAEGYPNANCIGCVKATSPTYWNLVRRTRPSIFAERCEQSRRLGARLVRYKKRRIFLDELPEDATGRALKNYHVECGLFCEEWRRGGKMAAHYTKSANDAGD